MNTPGSIDLFMAPEPHHAGLPLRDWFAGQALAGLCANDDFSGYDYDTLAETAYRLAAAMIAERG